MPELGLVAGLLGVAGAYGAAVRRQWSTRPGVGFAEAVAFLAGLGVLAVALVSPIEGAAHRRLWVHMVQHVLLISVAAPLLAIGRPVAVGRDLWHPAPARRPARGWALIVAAAGVQIVTLLVWHVPVLYDAAAAHDPLHALEHATLLGTALVLWTVLARLQGERAGLALLVVFVVSFPPLLLGAAMTFSTTTWYPRYAGGGVTDQQLAGVVMWAYGGLAAVAGGLHLFVRWLQRLEQEAPSRPVGAIPGGDGAC
jgi:putative membrane protein